MKPAGMIRRLPALFSDLSICIWLSTFALRGVGLRFRARIAEILGVSALTLAIDAGTVSPAELSARIEETLHDVNVDLWDACFIFALAALIVTGILTFIYFSIFEAAPLAATPGKLAFGVQVTSRRFEKFGFFRSMYRQLAKLATLGTAGIGYITLVFSDKRLALHDRIAKTRVVCAPKTRAWYRRGKLLFGLACFAYTSHTAFERLRVAWRWYEVLRRVYPLLPDVLGL